MTPFLQSRAALPAALLSLAVALAACGGEASPSASVPASPSQGEPSAAASESGRSALPSVAIPSFEGSAELEELIPDEVGGIALQKQSISGEDMEGMSDTTPETQALLENLEVEASDLSMAIAFGASAEGQAISIVVFRAAGVPSDRLLEVMRESAYAEREVPLEFSEETVGGKQVISAVDTEAGGERVYMYTDGDRLFMVTSSSTELSAEALAALP